MQATGILLSFLFGFLPMFVFAYLVYWTDRYEKEPMKLLIGVFIWGAVIAAGAAFLVNSIVGLGVYIFTGSETVTELTTSAAIAPVIEESLKGLACLAVFLIFRNEFDSILDGIVYASITAIGFAATENLYYLYTYGFLDGGLSGVLKMFFVRVILVGWQHPFYTSFIGIGLAVARLNRNQSVKLIAPLLGWMAAVITHSVHNTISAQTQDASRFLAGLFLDWSGWIIMGLFILWALYREQKWISSQLREEVLRGVITQTQYLTACSAWAQSSARFRALLSRRYRLVDRFYLITAELAYKKHQAFDLSEGERHQPEINRLRSELGTLSAQITS